MCLFGISLNIQQICSNEETASAGISQKWFGFLGHFLSVNLYCLLWISVKFTPFYNDSHQIYEKISFHQFKETKSTCKKKLQLWKNKGKIMTAWGRSHGIRFSRSLFIEWVLADPPKYYSLGSSIITSVMNCIYACHWVLILQ